MFRVLPPHIIRSANNCMYRIWYLSHHYCYLPLRHPQHTQTIVPPCSFQANTWVRRRSFPSRSSIRHLMYINTLETKIITNYIKVCNSYRTMNTPISIIKVTQILYREIIAVCSDNDKRKHTVWAEHRIFNC